ncbi:hypothetical protein NQ314_014788 [Rhamnusium bicolor]|uniref:Uncharacterized protein n=1 Tax=Rhamnusium bicolor TaxID=1586634 RepID=A0AAV8X188_9CUCU|nr:hypothetical protein NQ314_014788 [Rhamnusium bicolor]
MRKELISLKLVSKTSTLKKPLTEYERKKREDSIKNSEIEKIREFFEDDSISKICPGKRDVVKQKNNDEKQKKGPDYNSESETEKAAEIARLKALLKDWETASAGSRSLPTTPKRRPPTMLRADGIRSAEVAREMPRPPDRAYVSQIPQSIIHQSYGVTQIAYRHVNYNNPNYISQSPSHQIAYPSAMQYQAISPMFTSQPTYQPPPPRQYPSYNQHGSPIKTYVNNSPKHIPYEQPATYSPTHKLYGPTVAVAKSVYTNGELLQQQLFNHHTMQYQQYKEAREQVLAQHQQTVYRGPQRNYQSSVTIPIVVKSNQQSEMNSLHRKQYELT